MMGDVLGDCGHSNPIDGCMSCEDAVLLDNEHEHRDELMEAIARQNRFAARIGPPPTCAEHGRTPCEICGAAHQPHGQDASGSGHATSR